MRTSGRGGLQPRRVTGPTPRLADGKPDFSGVWRPDNVFVGDISRGLKPGDQILMHPEAEKLMKSRRAGDDPEANCLPTGIPRQAPYPWTIVQAPGRLVFLFEGNIHSYRQIFMDGRKHPEDPDPTWYGHSVGHWEGDTLVIDTTNFIGKDDFLGADENLHLTERLTRTGADTMLYQFTVDDPTAFTRPWSGEIPMTRTQEGLFAYECHEGNYSLVDILSGARTQERSGKR